MPAAHTWKIKPRLKEKDIVTVYLSATDLKSIKTYADAYLAKKELDKSPYQWAHSKGRGKQNPHEVGMRGEWAGENYFNKDARMVEFLAFRPLGMSDFGDVILKGKTTQIFDYKTQTNSATPAQLVEDDNQFAQFDARLIADKYRYLQGFVFCTNDPHRPGIVRLVGWILRKDFLKYCYIAKPGEVFSNSVVRLPYNRLKPMAELLHCKSTPVTEPLTVKMRSDFERGVWKSAEPYVAGIL